jgi:RNA polymerase sigma-70 factor (ECF subfamily)
VSSEPVKPEQPADSATQSESDDCADMARLAAGKDSALNDLMDRHATKLFNYLVKSLGDESDAADLAQDTFVRVYQHRDRFDPSRKFSTWLYTIATNLVKDRYRYRSRHPQVSMDAANEATGVDLREVLPDDKPSASESLEAEERAEAVRRAIAALPEELRLPIILFEYEELTSSEISEVLGGSVKAIESRIFRARQRLRASLTKLTQPL